MGFCDVLVVGGKPESSSKVTHCWGGLPPAGGAKAGGTEEAVARGKVGAGEGFLFMRAGGAGAAVRMEDESKRDMDLWRWEDGAAEAGGADVAGVGMRG